MITDDLTTLALRKRIRELEAENAKLSRMVDALCGQLTGSYVWSHNTVWNVKEWREWAQKQSNQRQRAPAQEG